MMTQRRPLLLSTLVALLLLLLEQTLGFTVSLPSRALPSCSSTLARMHAMRRSRSNIPQDEDEADIAADHHARTSLRHTSSPTEPLSGALATCMLTLVVASSPILCSAYDPSDYASETVTSAVQALKNAGGNIDQTFKAYESIADIITEGKGVGGSINYQGIQLERGYIADEDTSIYNPGLTLLTESEKERLVEAVIDARKAGLQQNQWSENNQFAYEFLKDKLDPLHMVELRGYLSIVPVLGAVLYLGVVAVQQLARDLFVPAYLVAAAIVFLPMVALVALGPQ